MGPHVGQVIEGPDEGVKLASEHDRFEVADIKRGVAVGYMWDVININGEPVREGWRVAYERPL